MMNLRALLLLASTAALGATPAFAQSTNTASHPLYLAATAPSACVIAAPVARNAQNASFSATGQTNGQITITQLVDGQTAQSRASTIELDFPVVCNGAHKVVVTSAKRGLALGGAGTNERSANGFADLLGYQIGIDWAGTAIQNPSSAGTVSLAVGQAARGDLAIRVQTSAGGGPLIAGQYSDSLVVQLTPTS